MPAPKETSAACPAVVGRQVLGRSWLTQPTCSQLSAPEAVAGWLGVGIAPPLDEPPEVGDTSVAGEGPPSPICADGVEREAES